MNEILWFVGLLFVGYIFGTINEKKHFRELDIREENLLHLPVTNFSRGALPDRPVESTWLVSGSAVVSVDYFKAVLSYLESLVGGGVGAYETLLDRARREAVLRMKESAQKADIIIDMRMESTSIGGGERSAQSRIGVRCVEVLCYGTAIKLAPVK